jgi:two-component sensor histidine kinase
VLTFSSLLATSCLPPILLITLDRFGFLGFSFQGSNFYFISYFVLALVIAFLGFSALLIRLTFQQMEQSLQNQYREGVDKEQLVTNEITRITNICSKFIHGNLQSSLITLSRNLELAVANNDHSKIDKIISEILELLRNPDLNLERIVGDIEEEVAGKCALWEGLVDIHPIISIGDQDLSPHVIVQVTDCVEELISNAVRHGKASAIEISIQRSLDATLVLTCTDNGIYSGNPQGGLGFKIYQEASNGDWTISRTLDDHLTVVRILINS